MTDKTHGEDGMPTISELERRHGAWSAEQTIVRTCARCEDFSIEGTVAETRAQFDAHLADAHPEIRSRRRRSRAGDREHAMRTVAVRRELAGVIRGDGAT